MVTVVVSGSRPRTGARLEWNVTGGERVSRRRRSDKNLPPFEQGRSWETCMYIIIIYNKDIISMVNLWNLIQKKFYFFVYFVSSLLYSFVV